MAAIQYLPYPLMVLNNQKTLVMANDAMGRLLDIEYNECVDVEENSVVERLWGKTLGQIGIDVLQNGRPVWVMWDSFLDAIAREMDIAKSEAQKEDDAAGGKPSEDDIGPTVEPPGSLKRTTSLTSTNSHDTVVEVVISPGDISAPYWRERDHKASSLKHTYAKMIITVWEMDKERYFALTFTYTDTHKQSLPSSGRSVERPKNEALCRLDGFVISIRPSGIHPQARIDI
jgi:hypothetical protein